ncbi:hypothetical protein MKK84_18690 [Methylobacterium sp. E-065]|uniref:hypothetical protein n=1 Tax=Methylobacterium sp. E-065 TaxID=2836583 RepID=UPI001FBBF95A|nr:hypothetical protein [Methylobacterium sp. E-065]MCJ2019439.1 hypothetical protein [Methylobacterium sp. E-065]
MLNKNCKHDAAEVGERSKSCESHDSRASEDASSGSQISITIANPLDIIRLAETQPNDAAASCQIAIKALHDGFLNRKYELLGAVVGIAFNMLAVQGEWQKFCRNDYWKQFKRGPKDSLRGRHKALSYVMRFVFLARSTSEINLTNRYAKMLEKEFNADVSPEEIAAIIHKHGGIEGMRQTGVASRKAALKRQRKKDVKYLKDLTEGPGDVFSGKNGYKISHDKYVDIKMALALFCKESKKYFKGRVSN